MHVNLQQPRENLFNIIIMMKQSHCDPLGSHGIEQKNPQYDEEKNA